MKQRPGVVVRSTLAFTVAALVGALAAGASYAHPRVSTGEVDHLTWALVAPIRSLEYTHSFDSGTLTVVSLGCETLVQYDRLGRIRPWLARSFSNPNPLTYVYTIRPNVKFWDGSTLTADDVVYSLRQAASAKAGSQMSAFYTMVRSITASGNRVTVRLKKPDAFFRYSPAQTPILQKRYWAANHADIGTPQKLTMCTGPFQFTSFRGDERIELKAFDDYWGGRPKVREITLTVITNEATRLLAMRQGEIDGSFRISPDTIDQWKQLPSTTVQLAPELRTSYISWDTATPPWNDVHVRRAMAYALDKAGIVKTVLRGYGQVAPTLPPPEQWGDLMSQAQVRAFYRTLPSYSYDPAKAKAELQQSAFPDGFKATIAYADSFEALGKGLLVLSQSVKKLGVDLKPKAVPTSAWYAAAYRHATPLGPQAISWYADYPDPADVLHFIYDSKGAVPNAFNTANYKNPEMDRLLAEQGMSSNVGVRVAAIKKALRLAAVDAPYLPMWYQDVAMAIDRKLDYKGFGTWYAYRPWALDITSR